MAKTTKNITNNFQKVGDAYEATTEVNNTYNVHVEDGGSVTIAQKTAGNEYGGAHSYSQDVVDDDYAGLVYPKTIKVICSKKPTSCVISVAN